MPLDYKHPCWNKTMASACSVIEFSVLVSRQLEELEKGETPVVYSINNSIKTSQNRQVKFSNLQKDASIVCIISEYE